MVGAAACSSRCIEVRGGFGWPRKWQPMGLLLWTDSFIASEASPPPQHLRVSRVRRVFRLACRGGAKCAVECKERVIATSPGEHRVNDRIRVDNVRLIDHEGNQKGVVAAREALGLSVAYFDQFSKQANELFEASITDKQFSDLIRNLYPKPETTAKNALARWENKVILIDELYHNSATNAGIKGTKWGALNALTERLDYFRSARKGNTESLNASASGFDPVITAEKNKILKAVVAL